MKTFQYENEAKDGFDLCVDAYELLTKKQFISKLREIEGISIIKSSAFSLNSEFCRFEYKGEVFSVEEDDFDYTYLLKPVIYNSESLMALEHYFISLDIPKPKTRPAFLFAGVVLAGLAVYANWVSS